MGDEPQVDVYAHIVFRECECQRKPLEGDISEGSFGAITSGPEQSRFKLLHLEVQFERVLMDLGALAFFVVRSTSAKGG